MRQKNSWIDYPLRFLFRAGLVLFIGGLLSSSVFAGDEVPFRLRTFQTTDKVVALTFDDGPHLIYTPKILALLHRENIKATFFMVGQNILYYPAIAELVQALGHDIGNHSFKHDNYSELSDDEVLIDLQKSQKAFYDHLGFFPKYFRPPYGRLKVSDYDTLSKYFLHVVMWSVDTRDSDKEKPIEEVVADTMKTVRPGSIILCHENKRVMEYLPEFIKALKKQGYKFITLSEIIRSSAP